VCHSCTIRPRPGVRQAPQATHGNRLPTGPCSADGHRVAEHRPDEDKVLETVTTPVSQQPRKVFRL
jgi:hypothetical protein